MPQPCALRALPVDLVAFMHGGVAAVVATRNARMVPAITRGWGTEVSGETRVLRLCVTAPADSATRANLDAGSAIAVAFSPPTIATAVQVKGTVTLVTAPDAQSLERAERHFAAFVAEARRIGARIDRARRLFVSSEFVSVTLCVEHVFDQTPGPDAGQAL